jgi:hypothetical protein
VCGTDDEPPGYNLTINFWVNTGSTVLNSDNYVPPEVSIELSQITPCIDFVALQVLLGTQPNGQPENIILGVFIRPQTGADEIEDASATIQMKVTVTSYFSSQEIIAIALGVMGGVVLVIIGMVAWYCYRKWRAAKDEENLLSAQSVAFEDFKKEIPEVEAETLALPESASCSICLGEFQPKQKVRKVVCMHIFHTECIDEWCAKTLSCPVCRLELSLESILAKKKEMKSKEVGWHDNTLSTALKEDPLDVA